jgi:hypothetical protein
VDDTPGLTHVEAERYSEGDVSCVVRPRDLLLLCKLPWGEK